ncbi:hypothetical protein [Actinoplanes sp. M2I2]|uniref:D-alanyl-D-alanine carboxypeptidase family protein n=1 Tax=Actinoplanes sp. M2I2 TaxID=1734444 RepID=UPI00201FFE16|nr:hypothetical protein [Actinoplanes sp. M2I2]
MTQPAKPTDENQPTPTGTEEEPTAAIPAQRAAASAPAPAELERDRAAQPETNASDPDRTTAIPPVQATPQPATSPSDPDRTTVIPPVQAGSRSTPTADPGSPAAPAGGARPAPASPDEDADATAAMPLAPGGSAEPAGPSGGGMISVPAPRRDQPPQRAATPPPDPDRTAPIATNVASRPTNLGEALARPSSAKSRPSSAKSTTADRAGSPAPAPSTRPGGSESVAVPSTRPTGPRSVPAPRPAPEASPPSGSAPASEQGAGKVYGGLGAGATTTGPDAPGAGAATSRPGEYGRATTTPTQREQSTTTPAPGDTTSPAPSPPSAEKVAKSTEYGQRTTPPAEQDRSVPTEDRRPAGRPTEYGRATGRPTEYGRTATGAGDKTSPPTEYGQRSGGGEYGSAPPRRKRPTAVLLAVLLLVLLLGAGATAQLTRSLPEATLSTTVATTMRIPGEAVSLPWPDQGSAELMIEGLGRLGGSGSDDAAPIGSVAKVMTAYVILRDHPISGDEEGPSLTVTAADVADYQARIASNQSLVPVRVGQKLTERDAIEALMLPSANNVAHQLAIWDAGSESAFVDKMNAAAADLGMTATRYTDPSGYLPTTISTAPDQVKLARAVLKSDVFAEIVALPSATIPVTGKIQNYNDLLGVQGVAGIKTGSTDEAGGCLLFSARLTVGDRKLTVVGAVFNQPGLNTPEQLANVNQEVRRLLRAVRQTVKQYTLVPAEPVGEIRTAWGSTSAVRPATPLKVVGWPGQTVPVQVTTSAPGASVTAGQPVGTLQAAGVRVDLRADTTTTDPSPWWRLTRTS